jgi:hypothetical protein|nr:hypothetical protein [Erythrobacter sp. HI0063]
MAVFELLVDEQALHPSALELSLRNYREFHVTGEASHVTGDNALHWMVIAGGEKHHSIEFRSFPVGAGQSRFYKEIDEIDVVLNAVFFKVDLLLPERSLMLGLLCRADTDISVCLSPNR